MKQYVAGVLYVFTRMESLRDKVLEDYPPMSLNMYDGSHRFHAAKRVLHETKANLPVTIAVKYVHPDESDDSTLEEMRTLNERVAIPAHLIAKDAKEQLRDVARAIADKTMATWPDNFSPSPNPQKPNVNRDALIDAVYRMLDDCFPSAPLKMNTSTLQAACIACIEQTNHQFEKDVMSKAKTKKPSRALGKAVKTGCFLFARQNGINDFVTAFRANVETRPELAPHLG